MINDEKNRAIRERLGRLGADVSDCVTAVRGAEGLDSLCESVFESSDSLGALIIASTPALAAFASVGELPDASVIPDAKLICGRIAVADGAGITDEFSSGCRAVMTSGRRFVIGGTDLTEAFMRFEALDQCAQLRLEAKLLGAEVSTVSDKHLAVYRLFVNTGLEAFTPKSRPDGESEAREELCRLVKLACREGLFGGTQGTVSKRLPDGGFVVTPYGIDREALTPDDLVLIEAGRRETGKNPSRSALLHAAIYEKNPEVGSIICAHPPRVMAFAVTDAELTAPEPIGRVAKFPFGASFMQRGILSDEIAEKPVCILENDCVITTGKAPTEAYSRLAALENAAKTLMCERLLSRG